MKLEEVLAIAEERNSAYRAILRQLSLSTFSKLYDRADAKEQSTLLEHIETGDYDAVRQWVRESEHRDIEDMTTRQLRDLGRKLTIRYYHSLTRNQLVKTILEKQDAIRRASLADEGGNSESGSEGGSVRSDHEGKSSKIP